MTDNKYYIYLERLRRSSVTNMWDSTPYLMNEFHLSEEEAVKIVSDWIGSYNADDYIGLDEF